MFAPVAPDRVAPSGSRIVARSGVQDAFSSGGQKRIACGAQDDMGGKGLGIAEIEVN